ncbi:MAG: PAS domain-containing sensor histidine kinase [Chitinophagaceae bacterium]|nr:PAS domain-containing sensor histidine kinase [Chitinophagaceae bacterium]
MNESTLFKIVEDTPVPIWLSDNKKHFVYFNKAWLKFRGRSLSKEIEEARETGIFSDDLPNVRRRFETGYKTKKPYRIEYRLRCKNGTYKWMLETANPRFDEDNKFLGFIGTCSDIHEWKELDRQKSDFITAVSHELLTPITSLKMYLHLLDQYFDKKKNIKYGIYAQGALNQLDRLSEVVNDLLDANKIREGKLEYRFTKFPLKDLINVVISKMHLLYPGRKIEFNCGKCGGMVYGDAERLSQALENLLANALKYSEEEDKVEIELWEDGENLYVDVTDYGIGISEDYHSQVFKKFFRVPGERQETFPGLGMGLYIAQSIVKKHNGKIKVESKENEYSKFSVKIPLAEK